MKNIELSNEIIIDKKLLDNYEGFGIFFIFHKKDDINIITQPVFIGPTRLKFNKSVELIIRLDNRQQLDNSSIYKYDLGDDEWHYISSSINNKEISLMANIDSGGIYAIIQEKNPPIVTNIYPGNDASYYQNDFREIKFKLNVTEEVFLY